MRRMEERIAQEQAQARADMDKQAEAWKNQVENHVSKVSEDHTSGLRQQLADSLSAARRLEANENSMAKNKGIPIAC